MLIEINKIKINDRIRKDFGDIDELAKDIEENGLINPPVVTPDYTLIAGERRLKALKSLGKKDIEVRIMTVDSAEQALNLEISENEVRKDFSKAERIDYARRLERIEAAKAKERQGARNDITQNFGESEKGESVSKVAQKLGIGSGEQYRKEKAIVDNKNLLSIEDFNNWDVGKLSTNKAFQKIKAENERLRQDAENMTMLVDMIPELEDLFDTGVVTKETLLGIMRNLEPKEKEEFINSINTSDKELITDLKEKIKHLDEEKKILEEKFHTTQKMADNNKSETMLYVQDANNYQIMEDGMIDAIRKEDYTEEHKREKLRLFYSNIDLFIKTRLAPSLYSSDREILTKDEDMRRNFKKLIDLVRAWTDDAYKFIEKNIYVEVE